MELLLTAGSGVLGGLILNIMPCVFPVLFFKLNAWITHADASPRERRIEALAYLGGTVAAFTAFAALVVGLRASGQSMGWGMQMQNPAFVGFIVAVLFAFGLNAVDVFSFNVSISGGGKRTGWFASFTDGALVTLVSTPCSAPFLGGAAAAALASDTVWWETMLLFWSIGLGLAVPVLLIGFIPALNNLLPRPGAWMEHMKIAVAFTLFFAAVWFFRTMQLQLTPESANDFLWFLVTLAGGLWLWEALKMRDNAWTRNLGQLAAVGVIAAGGYQFIHFEAPTKIAPAVVSDGAGSIVDGKIVWTPYSKTVLAEAAARKQVVFIDFTADWCASCKVFEKTHINVEKVRAAFKDTNVLAMKADLTAQDEALWDALQEFGRTGIPAYIIYHQDGTPELLPEGPPMELEKKLRAAAAKAP
jgi:thiol:disulfide interchange protein DsbD